MGEKTTHDDIRRLEANEHWLILHGKDGKDGIVYPRDKILLFTWTSKSKIEMGEEARDKPKTEAEESSDILTEVFLEIAERLEKWTEKDAVEAFLKLLHPQKVARLKAKGTWDSYRKSLSPKHPELRNLYAALRQAPELFAAASPHDVIRFVDGANNDILALRKQDGQWYVWSYSNEPGERTRLNAQIDKIIALLDKGDFENFLKDCVDPSEVERMKASGDYAAAIERSERNLNDAKEVVANFRKLREQSPKFSERATVARYEELKVQFKSHRRSVAAHHDGIKVMKQKSIASRLDLGLARK
jgi:hypothetical protein